MEILGIHIPFTKYKDDFVSIQKQLPPLGAVVLAKVQYKCGTYITELIIEAKFNFSKSENAYYWEGVCGIAKNHLFEVTPSDKWKHLSTDMY